MSDNTDYQFVDTNVFVYAYDAQAGEKHERAKAMVRQLWQQQTGCISIQILQELYVVVTRKLSQPLRPEVAESIVSDLALWRVHTPQTTDVLGAIQVQQRYQLSFWDSMIIYSANQLGCRLIWTEDLNAGQRFGDVQVKNPFA